MNELDARVRGTPLTIEELSVLKDRTPDTIKRWIELGTVEQDKLTGLIPLESALQAGPPGAADSGTASPHFNSMVGSGGVKGGTGATMSKRERILLKAEVAMMERRKEWVRLRARGQDDLKILADASWAKSRPAKD